jgi:GTP cyclohydrolase I
VTEEKTNIWTKLEGFYTERYKGWSGSKQFEGTGERLRKSMEEMSWLPGRVSDELRACFKAVYPDDYDEMLVSRGTMVWTLCPHHLLPCQFEVYIGYIPDGKVLGLSKFSRVAIISGRRPIMQEQYTRDVADAIMRNLKPKGVGVYVVGHHGCMGCRGVGQEIGVSTTTLKGVFKTDPSVKDEFYKMIGG